MFRKFAIATAAAAALVTAGMTAAPQQAAAKTIVHLGFGIGLPGYYGPGYYGGYYAPAPAYYYGPRYRVRCWRSHRRIRVWNPYRGRYVWRTVRGRRHCRRVRVW